MNAPTPTSEPLDIARERLARRSAHILGPSSAAHKALAELDRRRLAGEDVAIFYLGTTWFVGPPLRHRPPTRALEIEDEIERRAGGG